MGCQLSSPACILSPGSYSAPSESLTHVTAFQTSAKPVATYRNPFLSACPTGAFLVSHATPKIGPTPAVLVSTEAA
ncbi:hypothetical protein IC229_29075 [Spirosoma sp. BT702]|uniref:Uncharacterized protein n=1 Tax=Spirosoma profusum TaxID=2771354 RepID=A0A927G9Q0_9BACT|nr:hypothetical protein [Spirosoma profusum]MBD2704723.1 hypothetical protein [Spirosoma profusum]